MYEAERFLGMANLLRLLCKIINGFTIPVRQEHIHMFHRVLLPLFKVRQFTNLFQPVCYHEQKKFLGGQFNLLLR